MSDALPGIAPVPIVQGLEPYSSARQPQGIDLFLDRNEGPCIPPGLSSLLSELDAAQLRHYPSPSRLEASIAGRLGGLSPASVLVTAGADDALERAIRAVCGPGRDAVLTSPTFEMLGRYVRLTGAEAHQVEWWQGEYPLEPVVALASQGAALLAVVSPNNPTGATISGPALAELASRLPQALILLDHAYVEFADQDLTHLALELPNVLVLRTFSKAWGAAGLRVGFVAGRPEVVGWLRSVGQPYSVSGVSLALVEGLLRASSGPLDRTIEEIRTERAMLLDLLERLGLEPLPSEANFVLVRVANAERVRRGLASLAIAVRGFPSSPLLAEHLRITLPGHRSAYDRLAAGLETCIEPKALLLDMDGVLADVSRSYRQAIIETARWWQVEVSESEISAAKAEHGANNDWVVTRRLLARHGIEVSNDDVIERFETAYQGDPAAGLPGLFEKETPLVDRSWLEQLGRRYALGIVTGRPRGDALRFLERFDLTDCFDTVITMEDAPAKPDPAPVSLALERLGVRAAWMLGDSPDDIRAARAAGVLPIGVISSADEPLRAESALHAAGAVEVLPRARDIRQVLP